MTTPTLKKVLIDSIDVSDYIISFECPKSYTSYISTCEIVLSAGLTDVLTISDSLVGSSVSIQRGVSSATERYIFRGEVRNIDLDGETYVIKCRDKLYEAVRKKVTYSYDKNIDSQAGVVSEIFKDLINTYTTLTADSSSVQDSGTTFILDKFVCRDASIYERIFDLAKAINWQFYYDATEDKVFFEPKGFQSSVTVFEIGNNVTEVPKWTYNSDLLANEVIVRGAEQLVETTEYFDGDGTNEQEVQLSKTPVSVKVYVGSGSYDPTGTGTRPSDNDSNLKEGGKEGSTSGSYYYSYDPDSNVRKVYFYNGDDSQPSGIPPSGTNNIEVRYTWSQPVPVVGRNQESIDKYGEHKKVIVKSDIKNVSDAEVYMQNQLNKYSNVFASTTLRVIEEEDIDTGRVYQVIDNINDIDSEYLVSKIVFKYPNTKGDEVTVGDQLWKTNDWDIEVWDRLKRLEEQQTETTDLLVDVQQFNNNIRHENRYTLVQTKDRSSDGVDVFILGHPTFGVLGTQELGDDGASFTDYCMIPGNNIYKELLYDTLFYESGSSTGDWNTSTQKITLDADEIVQTKAFAYGVTHSYFTVNLYNYTGSFDVEISGDNGSTWQSVTLDTRTLFSSNDGTGVLIRITENNSSTATMENEYDDFGNILNPAIYCKLEE